MASNTTVTSSGRKYLCSAPRPDTWDEYLPSILKHLGKNDDQRKEVLRETLEKARAMNPFIKKIGPGRKTNAEHAIHFYEYLLEYLKESKTKDSDEQATSEEEEDEDEEPLEDAETQGEQSSMNTEEFNAQHNDVCDVCEEAGELLMCSTCNLVFHLRCVRPILDSVPNDKNWRCSYCILQTEPKNSKPRKQAAAAVRLMARLRNQNRRRKRDKQAGVHDESSQSVDAEETDQNESSQEDDAKSETDNAKSEKSNTKTNVEEVDDRKPEKNEEPDAENDCDVQTDLKEKTKPTTDGSNKEDLNEKKRMKDDSDSPDSNTRAKRNRKQPTLYDPQVGPARQWQSDELIEWKLGNMEKSEGSNQEDQKDEEDGSSSEGDENALSLKIAERTKEGEMWCGFCGDDPSVVVCFFCACRVCFGKHHQSKLLLCDQCDDEYHTFCLNPPLKTVPKSKKWFCPSCKASEEKRLARTSTRISTRAAITSAPSPRRSSARKTISTLKASESKSDSPSTPRPRLSNASNESKKRGRPKSSPESSLTSPPRKRGRPPKSASKGKAEPPRAGDGKSDYSETLSTRSSVTGHLVDDANTSIPFVPSIIARPASPTEVETPSLVSRSGRPVKRNSLLGAVGEGEQHLRTSRPGEAVRQDIVVQDFTKPKPVPVSSNLSPQQLGSSHSSTQTRSEQKQNTSQDQDTDATPCNVPNESNTNLEPPKVQEQIHQSVEGGLNTTPKTEQVSPVASALPSDPEFQPAVAPASASESATLTSQQDHSLKQPRRKPGARECMQISRRFGVDVVPEKYMEILLDYCNRGKVEHLIRMRERLDDHSRFLEQQLAGLEALVKEKGESDVSVPTKLSEEEEAKLPKHRKTAPQLADGPMETQSVDPNINAME